MSDVIDLTEDQPGEDASLLECKVVYDTQDGLLKFDGSALVFTPEKATLDEFKVAVSDIKGMQVSKSGNAKTLLKLISAASEPKSWLFDFTQVTNGLAWRDAFKDVLTKRIRDSAPASEPPTNPKSVSTKPVEISNSKVAKPVERSSVTLAGSYKGGTKDAGPGGHPAAAASRKQVTRLTAADISAFCQSHPNLLKLYAQQVIQPSDVFPT